MAKQEEIVEESDVSLRDSIDAAIEDTGESPVEDGTDGSLPVEDESIFPEDKVEEPVAEEPEPVEAKPEKAEERPDGDGKEAHETEDKKDNYKKAPVGWNAEQREEWSKFPVGVRKLIHDRERDMAISMQNTAQARQTHDSFNQLAQSYAPILAAEGVQDPMQAVQGLFKTVAELRMGTPEQKAQKIAAMINNYGVDIEALDNALVGNEPQPSQNTAIEHMIEQRMAPVNQLLSQLQERQQATVQQTQQAADQEVAQFQGEFLSDVRNDMADIIDAAASRGQEMNLQKAYDIAVSLRPEIQSVLSERQKNADLLGQEQVLDQKRNAASSLNGRQSGDGSGNEELSLRDQIAQGFSEQGRI